MNEALISGLESGRPLGISLTADQMNALYFAGHQLFELSDFVRAADAFRLLVLCEPLHVEAWQALGACHEQLDDLEPAAKMYSAGFHLGGCHPLLGLLAARTHLKCGEMEEAALIVDALRHVEMPVELEKAFRELLKTVKGTDQ